MKCPKCNSELVENIKYGSREYLCPNCDYGVSAFVNEPIEEDDTIYELCIIDESITIDKIKALAKILNYNFLDVKKICADHSIIYKGNAKAMKGVKDSLDALCIKYLINPEFKW